MIAKATPESLPFRFRAGDLPPDQDTIAHVRQLFLPAVTDLCVQIWLWAQATDGLKLGNISLDGTTLHADASKSHAVSDQRLLALEHQLRAEVDALFARGEQAEQGRLPDGLILAAERARRQARLANLAQAHAVLEARAPARDQAERTTSEAKRRAREETARPRKPRGPQPTPLQPGPRERDQYHCTDPESRLMQNRTNDGFDQHDQAQIATDQHRLLVVAHAWSNQANDQAAVAPPWDAWPDILGTPPAGAREPGYFSAANMPAVEQRGIAPSRAVGREPQPTHWSADGAQPLAPPPAEASPLVQMASKLPTELGQALYRLRTCTVEPVLGLIKAVLGLRQFSLRGLTAAAGEWCLVCLAVKLKRLHVL